MFEIKYKIFTSFIEEDDDFNGEYGYFQFCIDDKFYGDYREDIELDILSMNIYDWFENLIKAVKLLKNKSVVYISDIETTEVWIKMFRDEDNICLSEIYAEKPEGSSSVETDINLTEKNKVWEKTVVTNNFQKELISKGKQYLEELKKLNNQNHKQIEKLGILLKEIE